MGAVGTHCWAADGSHRASGLEVNAETRERQLPAVGNRSVAGRRPSPSSAGQWISQSGKKAVGGRWWRTLLPARHWLVGLGPAEEEALVVRMKALRKLPVVKRMVRREPPVVKRMVRREPPVVKRMVRGEPPVVKRMVWRKARCQKSVTLGAEPAEGQLLLKGCHLGGPGFHQMTEPHNGCGERDSGEERPLSPSIGRRKPLQSTASPLG